MARIKNGDVGISIPIILLLLGLGQIKVVSAANNFLGLESKGIINGWIEILIIIGYILTLSMNILIIRKYGKSILGTPFIYIMIGLLYMVLARVFIILFNFNTYHVSDTTLQFIWHIMFYSGMVTFLLAINNFNKRRTDRELSAFGIRDVTVLLMLGVLILGLFLLVVPLDNWLNSWFPASILDTTGLLHFIAFALAAFLSFKLFRISSKSSDSDLGKLISSFIPSFLLFLTLMSLNHFWELITESWGILTVEDSIIETGEQLFWLPSFFIIVLGFSRVRSASHSFNISKANKQDLALDTKRNSLMTRIIDVLTYHLGSDAELIAHQSCSKIGIQMNEIDEKHIESFGLEVQKLTSDLIGDFPSKFLNNAIQRV